MIIDWHSHWIAPDIAAEVAAHRRLPTAPEFCDVEARLRHMDAAGVERQVLSWPTTFGVEAALDPEGAASLYQRSNDRLAALLSQRPDRFSGLAAVPTASAEAAAAELERTHGFEGFIGAVVPADAFLTPDGGRLFAPLLMAAQRRRSHLYVHPGPVALPIAGHDPIAFLRVDKGDGRWLLESGTRLGAAALTLETSDLLDPFPDVSVHVAMMGGHLAWIAETLSDRAARRGGDPRIVSPLRRIRVDTGIVKQGGLAVELAAALFGTDRLLFGSDFPLFSTRAPAEFFGASRLDAADRHRILCGNGRSLLDHLRGSQAGVRASG